MGNIKAWTKQQFFTLLTLLQNLDEFSFGLTQTKFLSYLKTHYLLTSTNHVSFLLTERPNHVFSGQFPNDSK